MIPNRKLSFGEWIMYLDGKTPFNATIGIRFKGKTSLGKLEHALTKVQRKHPLLRAIVKAGKGGMPYFAFPKHVSRIPIRQVEWGGPDIWQEETKREWNTLLDLEKGPMARLVWIRGEVYSDLILTCHHCICDGFGLIAIMKELLLLLDQPEAEIGEYALHPELGAMVPDEYRIAGFKAARINFFIHLARWVLKAANAFKKTVKPELNTRYWTLSPDQVKALVKACKAEGASLHTALCVAFVRAFYKVLRNEKRDINKVISLVSIRKYFPQVKDDMLFSFALTTELGIDGNAQSEFWEVTRKVKDELNQRNIAKKTYDLVAQDHLLKTIVPDWVTFMIRAKNKNAFAVSNLGRVEMLTKYKDLSVERLLGVMAGAPWRSANTLFINTLEGRMSFGLVCSEEVLSHDEMEAIQCAAMRELEAASGLGDVPATDAELPIKKEKALVQTSDV